MGSRELFGARLSLAGASKKKVSNASSDIPYIPHACMKIKVSIERLRNAGRML
jgi:hypothetical protein